MRRFSVSPKITDLKALAVIAISFGVFISITTPVRAQSGSRVEALQARVQSNIRIVQEYINRKWYTKAEGILGAFGGQSDLGGYLSGIQKRTIERLKKVVKTALAERDEIKRRLVESDKLADEGRYIQAKQRIVAFRDSEYLTDMERGRIVDGLDALEVNVKAQTEKIQRDFNVAVGLYRQGETDKAKDIFEKIAESGADVKSKDGKTALDLIAVINAPAPVEVETETPVVPQSVPLAKAAETVKEPIDVESELLNVAGVDEAEAVTETAKTETTETEAATETTETETTETGTTESETTETETEAVTETTEIETAETETEVVTETTETETVETETEAVTETTEVETT